MRILLVAPQPFFEVRGTPLNVLQMCRALSSDGHEVHLATYPMGEEVDLEGLTIHRSIRVPGIRHVPIGYSKRKIILDLALALTAWRLLLRQRFDVVHAIEEAVFFCGPAARLRGAPLIYDLDSSISDQLAYSGAVSSRLLLSGIRRLERASLRRAACAVTVCRALTDFVRELAPETAVFQVEDTPLPWALREPGPEATQKLRSELGLVGNRVLVYTGNLEGYQGIDLLMEAIPKVVGSHPDVVFLIVGGSPEEVGALELRAVELGVAENLRLPGRCSPDMIPEYLGLADVLLSPRTQGENTPLKIYTYMNSGRPIVATELPTHTQVLDESLALLVPPTPEGLAEGIRRLLEEPGYGESLATAARATVQRDYNFEAFRRKLSRAYKYATRDLLLDSRRRSPGRGVPISTR